MDYNTFVSFIHSDLLTQFTKLQTRVSFNTTSAISADDMFITSALSFILSAEIQPGDIVYIGNSESNVVDSYVESTKRIMLLVPIRNSYADGAQVVISYNYKQALISALSVANNECASLVSAILSKNLTNKLDQETYVLKRALVHVYNWILQNKAFTKNINLTGLGISASDVYDHFLKLRNAEQNDSEAMRLEVQQELLSDGGQGSRGGGFKINFIPVRGFNGRYR